VLKKPQEATLTLTFNKHTTKLHHIGSL
jgi:hypothetical protein